jgi:predicted MFS family arabinose efflux permease
VLLAATARLAPPARRGIATGIVNAGGSFGQFIFVPIAQGITALAGWAVAIQSMAAIVLLALPAAWVLRGSARQATTGAASATGAAALPARAETTREAIARAMRTPGYLLLAAGFFVCGFHVAFIATHLPGVVAACQLPPAVGAWALAVVGLFNIVGSFAIGWAVGRWRMKSLLSLIYAARGVAVLLFLFAPKTEAVVLVFAAAIGITYLSTVPPTAGLVAKFFGTAHMATLFGFVMLSHQIGGFLGAWLGGKAFEATGSYDWMWFADIALCVFAAGVHLPIREARPQPVPAAA